MGRRSRLVLGLAGDMLQGEWSASFRSAEAREQARSRAREAGAQRVAVTLGEMKGAAMKLGQALSTGGGELPPEVTAAHSALQRDAEPLPWEEIAPVLRAELGDPDEHFAELTREPVAAASIAQVHRGRLRDGREVAVKVQHPKVGETWLSGAPLSEVEGWPPVAGAPQSEG